MDSGIIVDSILNFSLHFEGEVFHYVGNPSKNVRVDRVSSEGEPVIRGDREGTIKLHMVESYAQELAKGQAVHREQALGASGNMRSVVEALIAHHPQVIVCYQPTSSGSTNAKHLQWFDYVVHRPGDMLRRDDLGTGETNGHPERWRPVAPEWCLASEAALYLDENPSESEELHDLLRQSTRYPTIDSVVELIASVSQENSTDSSYSDEQIERAQWYLNFRKGEYGSWNDYFGNASPEKGLAERAVSTGTEGERLCDMLGLESPSARSTELAGTEMVGAFVGVLRETGMHVAD